MTIQQANEQNAKRHAIIRENKARRMRSRGDKTPLPVPALAYPDPVMIVYDKSGDYYGRISSADECPKGFTIRLETPLY